MSRIYQVSDTEPTNTKILWIDTNNNGALKYYDVNSNSWKFIYSVYGGQ